MTKIHLTSEQFAFMQENHELIERALLDGITGDDSALDAFIASHPYQQLFGNMLWDDVYDRYQDTPGYDYSLRNALREQLCQDIESGRVVLPQTPRPRKTKLEKTDENILQFPSTQRKLSEYGWFVKLLEQGLSLMPSLQLMIPAASAAGS